MSGVRGDARKRQQGEHLTHWDAGVRAVIEREVAKERERVLAAVEALAVQANDEAQTHWHYHNEAADDCDMDRANREGEVAEVFDQTRSALRILVALMREVTP